MNPLIARSGHPPFSSSLRAIRCTLFAAAIGLANLAAAQVNSYSDGSDGAFAPAANVEIDLSQAVTGHWQNSPGNGSGIYDGQRWAIVFKYSSVNIPKGVKVTFKNHPKNAPVVWLVSGDVRIDGEVNVDGKYTSIGTVPGIPGPGGFEGGAASAGAGHMAGRGPGGATNVGTVNEAKGGSYATRPVSNGPAGPIYGNAQIIPLVGGSGARGHSTANWHAGGGGGGAILIVSGGTLSLNGTISARGMYSSAEYFGFGYASGSGGAVKVIATRMVGAQTGFITVSDNGRDASNSGGHGRIRIEAQNYGFAGSFSSPVSSATAPNDPQLWPSATDPQIAIVRIGDVPVPSDPGANLTFNQDVKIPSDTGEIIVRIDAINVPTNWKMQVRVVPRVGLDYYVDATLVSGNQVASIWQARVTFPAGAHAVLARAYKP